jgi:hypothetical protein
MSDPTETARRVLDLDKQATDRVWIPWITRDADDVDNEWIATSSCHTRDEEQAKRDAALIAEYRTAAPVLARALIEAQAQVAALTERAESADRDAEHYQTDRNVLELRCDELVKERDAACREGRDTLSAMMKAVNERNLAYEEKALADREFVASQKIVRELVDGLREAIPWMGHAPFDPDVIRTLHACRDRIDALLAKHAAPAPTPAAAPTPGPTTKIVNEVGRAPFDCEAAMVAQQEHCAGWVPGYPIAVEDIWKMHAAGLAAGRGAR